MEILSQIMELLKPALLPLLEGLGVKEGVFMQAMAVLMLIRLVMKNSIEFLDKWVKLSPKDTDDHLPEKIKSNKVYKVVVYLLDLILSIKLKK